MWSLHRRRAGRLPRALRFASAASAAALCVLVIGLASIALAADVSLLAEDLRATGAPAPRSSASAETSTAAPGGACRECHPRESDSLAASMHAQLDCLRCHRAHGQGPAVRAADAAPGACLGCHPSMADVTRNHTADGSARDATTGLPLTCTSSCHDAMGTSHPFMLRTAYGEGASGEDALCLRCHDRVGLDY